MNGIGQAFGGFAERIEQPFLGKVLIGKIYHESPDHYSRGGKTVKGPDPLGKFLKGMGTDIHQTKITPVLRLSCRSTATVFAPRSA